MDQQQQQYDVKLEILVPVILTFRVKALTAEGASDISVKEGSLPTILRRFKLFLNPQILFGKAKKLYVKVSKAGSSIDEYSSRF